MTNITQSGQYLKQKDFYLLKKVLDCVSINFVTENIFL